MRDGPPMGLLIIEGLLKTHSCKWENSPIKYFQTKKEKKKKKRKEKKK